MKKYIHYCWFGDKPLPKLAKKCIKSWKKYLPDYEIICWSEENVNLNECPFIKEAYKQKKWAFVADYARTKAMYEMGGIYFDTDMEITKNIDFLLENKAFIGVEDSNMIACGVWYESEPKSLLATQMLDFYKSQKHFNTDDMYSISIPRVITNILSPLGFDSSSNEIQNLKDYITVYPREYFYPISYDRTNNIFTDNTCMIHYYDASWLPKSERKSNKIIRFMGLKNAKRYANLKFFVKKCIRKGLRMIFYPYLYYKRKTCMIDDTYKEMVNDCVNNIKMVKKDYVVFYNSAWAGITNATNELFDSCVSCKEIFRKKDVKRIAHEIVKNEKIKQVIFSSFCVGWKDIATSLKQLNPDIKLKTFFHGSHSQVHERYGWARNIDIYKLHKSGIIDVMGTCKESLIDFYKSQGCNIMLIQNNVLLTPKVVNEIKKNKTKSNELRIGLYAAKSNDWRKNIFTQIMALANMNNVVLDVVPINNTIKEFAKNLNIKVTGLDKPLKRDKLIVRMGKNDLNLYITFSECAPMLPIESLEAGTICLTGNNHHYFKNTELEEYLVISNEASAYEIKKKISFAVENKKIIMDSYKKWKKNYNKISKKSVEDFLKA